MDVNEIYEVHRRSKEKVNLVYQRSSGRLGHCFIDPTKPLRSSVVGSHYGYIVNNITDLTMSDQNILTVGVFKQQGGVEIFVKPANLWIHSGRVEQVVRILYGKAT